VKRVHLVGHDPASLPEDFWASADCEIMVMSRWGKDHGDELSAIDTNLPDLPSHVWIASSGTLARPGQSKWVALSKTALLISAAAVNAHLLATPTDSWGLALPLAHVGGLGILARAHLLKQKVTPLSLTQWRPQELSADHWQGEFLSLVPTQLHDLVEHNIRPPKNLRAVVVGGDRLDPQLAVKARDAGWPVLMSYGMTECCSQVATATVEHPDSLTLLGHVNASITPDGLLAIESPSLFTGICHVQDGEWHYVERTASRWLTQDLAQLEGKKLTVLGRSDLTVKVRGEKVDLPHLEATLSQLSGTTVVVVALPDQRDGQVLWSVSESAAPETRGLLPHQIPRGHLTTATLPRGPLGKIKRGELREWVLRSLAQRPPLE
jgi:O-succinylbenzoic acid--CoA ligase